MVNSNKGVPEPPNNNAEENLSANNDIVLGTDSDSDEDVALSGYEPLPLAPPEEEEEANGESSDSEDDSGVSSGGQPSEESLPSINRIENQLVGEVWSGPTSSEVDIQMDSSKVNEVKQAMANVTLPPSSIPEWANNIPEDQWKQHLLSRLQDLQKITK